MEALSVKNVLASCSVQLPLDEEATQVSHQPPAEHFFVNYMYNSFIQDRCLYKERENRGEGGRVREGGGRERERETHETKGSLRLSPAAILGGLMPLLRRMKVMRM